MDTSTRSTRSKGIALVAVFALVCLLGPAAFARNNNAEVRKQPQAKASATLNFCELKCGTEFSAGTARDISIKTSWLNLPAGEHVQQVILRLPNGEVYQKFETKFYSSSSKGVGKAGGMPTLTNVLPVAGSWIQQRSLTGAWNVEVSLDGALVKTGSFTIKQ